MAKRESDRNQAKHLDFIRGLPCVGCLREAPNIPHHESFGDPEGGWNLKDDRRAVPMGPPLTCGCHDERHDQGAVTWWRNTEIAIGLMDELWRHSGDQMRGERAVHRAWQERQNRPTVRRRA